MRARYADLRDALAGYRQTGVPLVAFDGTRYLAAGFGDDLGIYYFIPRLAVLSGFSLKRTIDLFFGMALVGSFLVGIVSLFVTLKSWGLRLWAAFSLGVLFYFSYIKGDVYILQSAAAIAVVPWFLHLLKKRSVGAGFVACLFGSGLLIGFANLMRSQAATGLGIFIVLLVALGQQCSLGKKLGLLAVLLAGLLIPVTYFHGLLARRDAYLVAVQPEYSPPLNQHPFWDTVYLGFGFIDNPYVPDFRNELSAAKVASISPSTPYLSAEYNRIIRTEALRIVRDHPLFVLRTIVAKVCVVALLLLACCNVALFAVVATPMPWAIELAFGSALAFNSLFGIMALPEIQYLLGFMAFGILYGLFSLAHALDQPEPGRTQGRLRLFDIFARRLRRA